MTTTTSKINTDIDFTFSHFASLSAEQQIELAGRWWAGELACEVIRPPQSAYGARSVTIGDGTVLVALPDAARDEHKIVLVRDGYVVDVTVLARIEACQTFARLLAQPESARGHSVARWEHSPYHLSHGLLRGFTTRPRGPSMKGRTTLGNGVVLRSAALPGDVVVDGSGQRLLLVRNAAAYGDPRALGWHEFGTVTLDGADCIAWV